MVYEVLVKIFNSHHNNNQLKRFAHEQFTAPTIELYSIHNDVHIDDENSHCKDRINNENYANKLVK